jgi:hypothetical protein
MSAPSTTIRALGAAAVVALAVGLATHVLTADKPDAGRHFKVARAPLNCTPVCYELTALASQGMLALGGVSRLGAVPEYTHARIAVCPGDGGTLSLPAGMTALDDTARVMPCPQDPPELEVWVQGEASAPFPCACSTGSDCFLAGPEQEPAPLGVTLQPGWTGAGCKPKTCVELAGSSSWPEECPP